MLKLLNDKFYIESADLRKLGMRSPQGFTFELSNYENIGNFFWTTNEFTAYLFHKRYGIASPEVKLHFDKTLAKQKELYELSYAIKTDFEPKKPNNCEYRPYQKVGVEYCLKGDNILIADDMRIGKTCQSIGVINNLPSNKTLIICPKTAKLVWINELDKWLINYKKIQVLNSKTEIDYDADIYVLNYDILHRLSELKEINFDLIIADEAHLCKNEKARRTRFFFELKAKKKLALTGTPLLNKPKDLLTLLKWLDPFWDEWRIYKGDFASKSGILLCLEEVHDWIRSTLMLRRVQAQVFDTEPIERRLVPLEPAEDLKPQIQIEKDSYKKSWRLNDYTLARKLIGLSRVQPAINHILTYTSEGDKMVVFAWHKPVVDRIAASLGKKAVKVYGDTNDKERKANIERFQNDPECQVIIGSIPALSMAVNLSVSNHLLFVESCWENGLMEQAEERCSDKDQKRTVLSEYLVFENSLDEHMFNVREGKEEASTKATDVIY